MATELDNALNNVVDRLTAPGGMLEVVPFERFGRELPMLKNAPPTLPALFAHFCAQHGEATFLVDGPIRTSFAGAYEAAREVAGALVEGQGVKKGDRIGIAARNSTNWIIAYMAVEMAGGCAALLSSCCWNASSPCAWNTRSASSENSTASPSNAMRTSVG